MAGKPERFDAVVALDGSGNFSSINDAIAAAPSASATPHVVYIKAGVYREFVRIKKSNITLVGDRLDKTIISESRCLADADAHHDTAETAIVGVDADGFIAKDLCIENTAGTRLINGQAVALLVASERSVVFRCALRGYQDTLCALAGNQFYRECRISGTVDFVFGNAAAVFQKCQILARLPLPVHKRTITAQARRSDTLDTGFVFQQCSVAADDDLAHAQEAIKTYLGRPYQPYSRTVFMQCTISGVVDPEGWLQWEQDPVPETLFYAEFMNNGPGADVSRRVRWPGFHVIGDPAEVGAFTVQNFIKGEQWLPGTGVEFTSGL